MKMPHSFPCYQHLGSRPAYMQIEEEWKWRARRGNDCLHFALFLSKSQFLFTQTACYKSER